MATVTAESGGGEVRGWWQKLEDGGEVRGDSGGSSGTAAGRGGHVACLAGTGGRGGRHRRAGWGGRVASSAGSEML